MVSGVNGVNSDSVKQMLADIYNKMSVADIDGKAGLSMSELASVNTDGDVNTAAFQKVLTEQFDKLDADKDGQLSQSELLNSSITVTPTISATTSNSAGQTNNSSTSFGNLAESCIQKLMNSYKNGGLTSLLSSLHLNG